MCDFKDLFRTLSIPEGSVSDKTIELLDSCFEEIEVKKGTIVIEQGEICHDIYVVKKGLIRQFYNKPNGKEVTQVFSLEGFPFCSIESLFNNDPALLTTEALEDCIVYKCQMDMFSALCEKYMEIEMLYRRGLEVTLLMSQDRVFSIQFETAQQRYQKLLQNSPAIIQRVSSKIIASYLGVTPETLSRIKSM